MVEGDFSHSAEPGLIGKHWLALLGERLHRLARVGMLPLYAFNANFVLHTRTNVPFELPR